MAPNPALSGSPGRGFPRSFLLTLGTGMTFGFGCAYLLLSVLSVDERASWITRLSRAAFSLSDPSDTHWETDDLAGPSRVPSSHGDDEEFHHRGEPPTVLLLTPIERNLQNTNCVHVGKTEIPTTGAGVIFVSFFACRGI